MSSIGQGPVNTDHFGKTDSAVLNGADHSSEVDEKTVDRGFTHQNSYSRVEGNDEASKQQVTTPVLDEPSAESEAKGSKEILKMVAEGQMEESGKTSQEISAKKPHDPLRKPLSKQAEQLDGNSDSLESMGFKKSEIGTMLMLADPDDPNNTLAPMHSTSARMDDVNMETGEAKLGKLFNVFEDVLVKFSAITEIPNDLREDLIKDFEHFTRLAGNSNKPLDIDAATTLLIQIQSKLQNERLRFDQESIKIGQVEVNNRSAAIIDKIRNSIAKIEKAERTGRISKIFGYISLALMAVAMVAVTAISFGTLSFVAVGLMALAMGVMVAMIVSSETGNNFMIKIFDGFAGGDEDKKKKTRIAAMVFWSVVMIALSAGGAAVGGISGAGSAVASTASTAAASGATVTATGVNTAAAAISSTGRFLDLVTKIAKMAQLIGGASQMASGASDISTAVFTYQADIFRAEALEEKADMARIQQSIDDAMEGIEKAISELQAGWSAAAGIVKANHETNTTLARNLRA